MVSEVSVHGWQVQTQKDDGEVSPTGKLFTSLDHKAEREGRRLSGRDTIPGHDPSYWPLSNRVPPPKSTLNHCTHQLMKPPIRIASPKAPPLST